MNNQTLKQLAQLTIKNGQTDPLVTSFVIKNLTPKQLKKYLFYLKQIVEKNRVYITIAEKPSTTLERTLHDIFTDKDVIIQEDNTLVGGMRARTYDMVVDLSVKGLIEKTVNTLKKDL